MLVLVLGLVFLLLFVSAAIVFPGIWLSVVVASVVWSVLSAVVSVRPAVADVVAVLL